MKVIKRDGTEVSFQKEKIITAIFKANQVTEQNRLTEEQINEAAEYISFKCSRMSRAVSVEEIHDLMGKLHPAIYTYHKNEFIKNSFDNRKLYLVLEGIVYFYTQNEQYDEEIVAFFPCGHLFPGSLMTETDGQSLHFAICKTNCKIAAIDVVEAAHYHIFHSFVGNKCCLLEFTYHFTSLFLAWHCHILQQKTVRSKIMVFLQCQSECQQNTCIHIEMPYSDLSNFLQVDRSTLMKELAKMESEELIQKNGRYITLQQLHSEIYRIPI